MERGDMMNAPLYLIRLLYPPSPPLATKDAVLALLSYRPSAIPWIIAGSERGHFLLVLMR